MSFPDLISVALVFLGLAFFVLGTIGLLRFPDVFTRLHALTKADNLGLGLIITGLAIQAPDGLAAGKLALIWLLALNSSATACYLVAHAALRTGVKPTGDA